MLSVLILVPTKELTVQVLNMANKLINGFDVDHINSIKIGKFKSLDFQI